MTVPRYDYECRKCDAVQEFILPMADKPPVLVHEGCGGKMIRRFSPPAVNLRQGQAEIVREGHGTVTKHWDGRQDVHVTPPRVDAGTEVQ